MERTRFALNITNFIAFDNEPLRLPHFTKHNILRLWINQQRDMTSIQLDVIPSSQRQTQACWYSVPWFICSHGEVAAAWAWPPIMNKWMVKLQFFGSLHSRIVVDSMMMPLNSSFSSHSLIIYYWFIAVKSWLIEGAHIPIRRLAIVTEITFHSYNVWHILLKIHSFFVSPHKIDLCAQNEQNF